MVSVVPLLTKLKIKMLVSDFLKFYPCAGLPAKFFNEQLFMTNVVYLPVG
jgi:hypothetical protein